MNDEWKKILQENISENIMVKQRLLEQTSDSILRACDELLGTVRANRKILICGNGGSAADAQHIAAELVIRLRGDRDRPAIAAQALTVDTSILTAAANDYGFDFVFSRQIEALGQPGDTLIAISTSGNSSNIIEAVNMAHERGLYVTGFLGRDGGKLKKLVDLPIVVPSNDTARIQEAHITIGHIICDLLERTLFSIQ